MPFKVDTIIALWLDRLDAILTERARLMAARSSRPIVEQPVQRKIGTSRAASTSQAPPLPLEPPSTFGAPAGQHLNSPTDLNGHRTPLTPPEANGMASAPAAALRHSNGSIQEVEMGESDATAPTDSGSASEDEEAVNGQIHRGKSKESGGHAKAGNSKEQARSKQIHKRGRERDQSGEPDRHPREQHADRDRYMDLPL